MVSPPPHPFRDSASTRVAAINLGDDATHIVVLNLPPTAIARLVGEADTAPALPLAELAPRFFESRPAYPLVRIRLDPGEGVWFPADVIYDGWTCEKRELHIVLTIRGGTAVAAASAGRLPASDCA